MTDKVKARKYALVAAFCFLLASGVYIGTTIAQAAHGHRLNYLNLILAAVFAFVGMVMLVRAKRLKIEADKIDLG